MEAHSQPPAPPPAAAAATMSATSNGATIFEAGPSRPRVSRTESSSDGKRALAESPTTSLSRSGSPTRGEPSCHLDLATYPTPQLLRLLASLLQQIASSNDQLRTEHDDQNGSSNDSTPILDTHDPPQSDQASATSSHTRSSVLTHDSPTAELFQDHPPSHDLAAGDRLFTAAKISLMQPSSILSFHARHVPSITIEAYLLRILKYCPTTNEVFLGLLVYFDRMSKLGTPGGVGGTKAAVGPRGFAIDSYNVHRLIIAGVTVASKFFSDVFYTNSRYAKVGGLPPHELNQLELQFLLLNNFTLMIPPEEMQRYGDRLLAYWQGREEAGSGCEGVLPPVVEDKPVARPAERGKGGNGNGNGDGDATPTTGPSTLPAWTSRSTGTEGAPQPAADQPAEPAPARQDGMEVDERPALQRQSSSSATAPATPSHAPAPTLGQLTRSASVPRRPTGDVPMRAAVSFAPSVSVQRDSAVGVGL